MDDSYRMILDDAILLLEEWDRQDSAARGDRYRVMNPDLADIVRRKRALDNGLDDELANL